MKIRKLLVKKNADYHSFAAVNILFLGDSITHGCFEMYKGNTALTEVFCDFEHVYHAQLKKMLNEVFPCAPINMMNAGISGNSAMQGLERIERDVLRLAPDLVVVCFGLNDSGGGMERIGSYAEALGGIFTQLSNHKIESIFMTPNMKCTYVSPLIHEMDFKEGARGAAEVQNTGIMDAYMQVARKTCDENGIAICECYDKWKKMNDAGIDTTLLLANYINHPTRKMHGLFAMSLFDMIMFS